MGKENIRYQQGKRNINNQPDKNHPYGHEKAEV